MKVTKLKKLIIASALSSALVSPAVFAQAQNFEGFGLQLSTGYQNNELKFSDLKAPLSHKRCPQRLI
jgi:hypothetical protein